MKSRSIPFETEADLVAAFVADLRDQNERFARLNAGCAPGQRRKPIWTVYPETGGWDLLLVDDAGVQIGVEAKLSLNAKVICQALPGHRWSDGEGPDYRAVLVPFDKVQGHLHPIAAALGLTVLSVRREEGYRNMVDVWISPQTLPDENGDTWGLCDWFSWLPAKRCALPEYVPDVEGGKPCPVALTTWKIKAIKLMILLDRRGGVTRADMKHLGISPTRWTDAYNGFLAPDSIKGQYVRCARTPDLKAQHPTNWQQIEADFAKWAPADLLTSTAPVDLFPANDTQPKESAA
jgi:hypothetical protein